MPEQDPGRTPGDEAVSAVLGVILLVAMGVVLAAGVFYFSSQMSKPQRTAPSLAMTERGQDVQVVRAGPDLDWFEDFVVKGSCVPLLNGQAFPSSAGTPVSAGDVLTCDSGEDLAITSSEAYGNTMVFQKSFL